jgi:hypothetical protein
MFRWVGTAGIRGLPQVNYVKISEKFRMQAIFRRINFHAYERTRCCPGYLFQIPHGI